MKRLIIIFVSLILVRSSDHLRDAPDYDNQPLVADSQRQPDTQNEPFHRTIFYIPDADAQSRALPPPFSAAKPVSSSVVDEGDQKLRSPRLIPLPEQKDNPSPHQYRTAPVPEDHLRYPDEQPRFEALPAISLPSYQNCYSQHGVPRMCQERSTCFYTFSLYTPVPSISACVLRDNARGVCCPTDEFTSAIIHYGVDDAYENIAVRDTRDKREYHNAHEAAKKFLQKVIEARTMIDLTEKRKAEQFHQSIQRGTKDGIHAAKLAFILNQASRTISENKDYRGPNPEYITLRGTSLEKSCRKIPQCTLSPYRTLDGSCNNLKYPLWGSTNSGLHRISRPDYGDGRDTPRSAVNGKELPSSRYLSLKLVGNEEIAHVALTHMAMNFGQFVAHDLTRVAVFTGEDDKVIKCCTRDIFDNPRKRHPACYPIPIPSWDEWYLSQPCMEFVRAMPAQPDDCKLTYARSPMNQVSHFLDGSFVYGSDQETLDKLRSYSNGLLKTIKIDGEDMLPQSNSTTCGSPQLNVHCFRGGDLRINQEPPILAQHTLLVREHNRLATDLSRLNAHWDDERIFQEARKILVAQLQHITYNEFVPLLLNYETRRSYGLLLKSKGYGYNYDPRLKPNVLAEFQAAAFRIGHSLVRNHFTLFDNHNLKGGHWFQDQFFNPSLFYTRGNLERIIGGLVVEQAYDADHHFSLAMVRQLFKKGDQPGLDIFAINLQRGRDIGVNGYNHWREVCGLPKAKQFEDFGDVMNRDCLQKLKSNYEHVDDVDLYAAGVMEFPVKGTIAGPTFACIIADQFRRLKLGDRFWYERHDGREGVGFTPDQLAEIRQSTFSRLVCDNTMINIIQPLAFLQMGGKLDNPSVYCSSLRIPALDLRPWKE